MPHTEPKEAVELVVGNLKNAPHPPQLSRADPREQMWIQFSEGLPGFNPDFEAGKHYFDTSEESAQGLHQFFEDYLAVAEGGDAGKFSVSPEYGLGIHEFLGRLRRENVRLPYVKLHVTGPMSFSLVVTDQNGTPVFYDQNFREVAVKGMGLKAVWLVEQFREFAEQVILFFDEPSLSAYGSSAYLGVSRDDVITSLNDVIDLALVSGAIPGVHCCGNTDWGILMDTRARIINFDAVDYMETMPLYAEKLTDFYERGGVLAWGAVPNDERIEGETAQGVIQRIRNGVDAIVKRGVEPDLVTRRIIITPACGCAGLSPELTAKAYGLLGELDSLDSKEILGG
jgi:hypothetical protein